MKKVQLRVKVYVDAFKNIGTVIVRNYFKSFTWSSFIMFAMILYAYVFGVGTGFAFD